MNLSAFLSQNALKSEVKEYVVSKRFIEKGEPIPWKIQSISGAEDERLRQASMKRIPIPGKYGQFTSEIDINQYLGKLAVACTVEPNLHDKELQDSYNVMCAETLIKTMLLPGEYADYLAKIQEICGFEQTFSEKVEQAKN